MLEVCTFWIAIIPLVVALGCYLALLNVILNTFLLALLNPILKYVLLMLLNLILKLCPINAPKPHPKVRPKCIRACY